MMARELADWDAGAIQAQCVKAYRAYRSAKTDRYERYFAERPGLRDKSHAFKARDLRCALPDGWGDLERLLAVNERHQHHLSGNSSQALALGLLGPAAQLDPSLTWLWDALAPIPPAVNDLPRWKFEATVSPALLDERPRQTSIDLLVEASNVVICIEAKWTEEGLGQCSCARGGGDPRTGRCADRVLERHAYWATARDVFGLPERRHGRPCPISPVYQAVRNAAAARTIAGPERSAVFGLIYDAENPYFAGSGDWPGWPTMLDAAVSASSQDLRFSAISWQDLLPLLPAESEVHRWASEKHGLV